MRAKNNSVLIARDIQLTFNLRAKSIYVDSDGCVTIVLEHFGPKTEIPELTVDYLDAICSKYYYGGYTHQDAIADIMLLNSVLTSVEYDDFYSALESNLLAGNVSIISSPIFQ